MNPLYFNFKVAPKAVYFENASLTVSEVIIILLSINLIDGIKLLNKNTDNVNQ